MNKFNHVIQLPQQRPVRPIAEILMDLAAHLPDGLPLTITRVHDEVCVSGAAAKDLIK